MSRLLREKGENEPLSGSNGRADILVIMPSLLLSSTLLRHDQLYRSGDFVVVIAVFSAWRRRSRG